MAVSRDNRSRYLNIGHMYGNAHIHDCSDFKDGSKYKPENCDESQPLFNAGDYVELLPIDLDPLCRKCRRSDCSHHHIQIFYNIKEVKDGYYIVALSKDYSFNFYFRDQWRLRLVSHV